MHQRISCESSAQQHRTKAAQRVSVEMWRLDLMVTVDVLGRKICLPQQNNSIETLLCWSTTCVCSVNIWLFLTIPLKMNIVLLIQFISICTESVSYLFHYIYLTFKLTASEFSNPISSWESLKCNKKTHLWFIYSIQSSLIWQKYKKYFSVFSEQLNKYKQI